MRNPFFGKSGPLTIMRKRPMASKDSLFLLPPPSPRRPGRPPRGSTHGSSVDSICSSEDGAPRRRLRNSSLASTSNSSTSSANANATSRSGEGKNRDGHLGDGAPVSLDDDISVGDVGVVGTASSGFLFSAGDTESYDSVGTSQWHKRPTPRRSNGADRDPMSVPSVDPATSWNSPTRTISPEEESNENDFEALDYFNHCLDQSPEEESKATPTSPDVMSHRSSFVSQITDGTCGTDVTEVTHKRRNTSKSPGDRKRGRDESFQLQTLATEDSDVCLADLEVEQILSGDGQNGASQIILSTPVRKRPDTRTRTLPRRPPTPPSNSSSAPSPRLIATNLIQNRSRSTTDIYCTPPRHAVDDNASFSWETDGPVQPTLLDCPSVSPRDESLTISSHRPLTRRRTNEGGSHNSSMLESFLPSIFACCSPEGAAANVVMENNNVVVQVTKPIPVKHRRKSHRPTRSATPPTVTSTPAISVDNEEEQVGRGEASPGKGKWVDDALLLQMARMKVSGMTKTASEGNPVEDPQHKLRDNSDGKSRPKANAIPFPTTELALGTLRPRTNSIHEFQFDGSFRSIGTAATNHEATYRPPLARPPTPQRMQSLSRSSSKGKKSLSALKDMKTSQRGLSSRSILDSESEDGDGDDLVISQTLTGHVEIAVADSSSAASPERLIPVHGEMSDDPFPHSPSGLRHMSGPEMAAVSVAPKDGATSQLFSEELRGSYLSYRASSLDVNDVFRHMDTVVPLHHDAKFNAGGDYEAAALGGADLVAVSQGERPPRLTAQDRSDSLPTMGVGEKENEPFAIDTCFDRRRRGSSSVDNICSEPDASSIKVRGPRYRTDGVKMPSEEAMFSLLGVDSFLRNARVEPHSASYHCCKHENSYLDRLRTRCKAAGVRTPFLLVYNLVLPWGNLIFYMHRPDATGSGPFNRSRLNKNVPSEMLWKKFLTGDDKFRNQRLKFIPNVLTGPWMVKRMVGQTPALIGQKLPVSYFGSLDDHYLEICLDVTSGSHLANTISSTIVSKSDASVTLDLSFVIEGRENGVELPERVLSAVRLHHLVMKHCRTREQWRREVEVRNQIRAQAMEDEDEEI